jgi:GNAT superfamily N-acetyltransferase
MDLILRKSGSQSDWEAVQGILAQVVAWLNARAEPLWDANQISAEVLHERHARGELFLAESANEIVGTVFLQLYDRDCWPEIEVADSVFIHKLAVSRKFAGMGNGQKIIGLVMEYAGTLGKNWLRLDCDAGRMQLRQFYEACGFEPAGLRQLQGYTVARYQQRVT